MEIGTLNEKAGIQVNPLKKKCSLWGDKGDWQEKSIY